MSAKLICVTFSLDGSNLKSSNELQITLPLDTQQIRLPPAEVRQNDEDMYKEYVEIRDGSGYVPAMEQGRIRFPLIMSVYAHMEYCLKSSEKVISFNRRTSKFISLP